MVPLFFKCICSSPSFLCDSRWICFHPDPPCSRCMCVSNPPPVCFRGIACSSKQGSLRSFSHVCSIHEFIQSHSVIPTAYLFEPSGLVTIHTCSIKLLLTQDCTILIAPAWSERETECFHARLMWLFHLQLRVHPLNDAFLGVCLWESLDYKNYDR